MLSPLKDIAIYRLQRVEKALKRLNQAVSRLDTAADKLPTDPPNADPSTQEDQETGQYELVQAELKALQADYDRLHTAATTVAGRLDETIARLEPDAEQTSTPKQAPSQASA